MHKLIFHVIFPALAFAFAFGYLGSPVNGQTISGIVSDTNGQPLAGVNVVLPALQRGASTDSTGTFIIEKIPEGIYVIMFSMIGYQKETHQVDTRAGDVRLHVVLHISPLDFPSIVLTAKPQPTDVLSSPQSVTVLEGRQLDRGRGQSTIHILENSPGVATFSTGSGIVKPSIRGLTSQRVLVVVDGVRQEGQQWSDEHAPEIDAFDTERIEVIRGPNSVLYGSDALGGVINIKSADVPAENVAPMQGKIMLSGFSNNRQGAGALSLYGMLGKVNYRTSVSARSAGDITTPKGRLPNSGMSEYNGRASLGVHGLWGSATLHASRVNQKFEIYENPAENPGATPYQRVTHDKIHLNFRLPLNNMRIEADAAWQNNHRREFEAQDEANPELNLLLGTGTLDIKVHHYPIGPVFGTAGFSLMQQRNQSLARDVLIPQFRQRNLAFFLYEEMNLRQISLSAGLRLDSRQLKIGQDNRLALDEQVRRYQELSGLLGAVWRISAPLAIAANFGRAWRAPTAFELFVDGVHEGTVRYETGDENLQPENALNLDVSLRFVSARMQGELAFFHNKIEQYIYLQPTGATDPESGFRKYQHSQTDALLQGAEFTLTLQATDWLTVTGGADFLHAERMADRHPLPLVPANRFKAGVQAKRQKLYGLHAPYVSVQAKIVQAQNRVAEYESPTPGYTTLRIAMGAEIPLHRRALLLDIRVDNVLNTAYRDHLNRYKEYALDPGRNVVIMLSLPFEVKN